MNRVRLLLSLLPIAFGLATLSAGGEVLFGSLEARQAAGAYVPFVVWFNFSAGFAYLLAGAGLAVGRRWATWLAVALAASTALVFMALGAHIAAGYPYELHTVKAMSLRTAFWAAVAALAWRADRAAAGEPLSAG